MKKIGSKRTVRTVRAVWTKVGMLLVTILVTCVVSNAQDYPHWQIYGGYQYSPIDTHAVQDIYNLDHTLNPTTPLFNFGSRQDLSGWNFGGQENANSWFGFVIDISGNYGTNNINLVTVDGVSIVARTKLRAYTFMGGPQFALRRNSRLQPFARALFGGAWFSDSENVLANNVPLFAESMESDSSVALGGGGGIDVLFSRRVGLRVAADYIRSYVFSNTQNNYRASVGLIFRLER